MATYQRLTGRDIYAKLRRFLKTPDDLAILGVQIKTPVDGAATVTVEYALTDDMLQALAENDE